MCSFDLMASCPVHFYMNILIPSHGTKTGTGTKKNGPKREPIILLGPEMTETRTGTGPSADLVPVPIHSLVTTFL